MVPAFGGDAYDAGTKDSMCAMKTRGNGRSAPFASRIGAAILCMVVGYLAFRALLFVRLAYVLTGYPFDIDYNEGFMLNEAQLLARGERLYADINRPPWYVTHYTPLYPAICSVAIRLGLPGLWACRTVSMISTVLICVLLYLSIRRMGGGWTSGDIGALAFPASTYVVSWGCVAKADVMAVLLDLLAVYLLLPSGRDHEGEPGHPPRVRCTNSYVNVAASAICCTLALYTRQTMIAAPLAAGAMLFVHRRRMGIVFGAIFLVLSASAFLALDRATQGEFEKHIFSYTVGIFDLGQMFHLQYFFWRDHFAIAALAVSGLIGAVRRRSLTVPWAYLLPAFLVSLSCGHYGASSNHFLELYAVLCLCSGTALEAVRRRSLWIRVVVAAGIVLQSSWVVNQYSDVDYWLRPPTAKYVEDGKRLVARLKQAPGEVLCEYNGFTLLAGKKVLFHPNALSILAKLGRWDQTPMLTRLENRTFGFLACEPLKLGRWSPEMARAIQRGYEPIDSFAVYKIDRPTCLIGLAPREPASGSKPPSGSPHP